MKQSILTLAIAIALTDCTTHPKDINAQEFITLLKDAKIEMKHPADSVNQCFRVVGNDYPIVKKLIDKQGDNENFLISISHDDTINNTYRICLVERVN